MTKPPSDPDLLVEVGVEELPASFVREALEAMPRLLAGLLGNADVVCGFDGIQALGTPRRLAVRVPRVAPKTASWRETVVGPPKKVAVDEAGAWTKAAQGFAKKNGFEVADLRVEPVADKGGGEYVVAERQVESRPVEERLVPLLPELLKQIPFRKSMRWGDKDVAFGRPIHWLVALHGDRVVEFEFAGIRAGRTSYGHRFLAPGAIELGSADEYVQRLREAHVLVDVAERRQRMREGLEKAASELGGELVEDAFLMDECVSLVEEPFVVPGRFDEAFLELPDAVVVSVMRDHQRYFAVREQGSERLLPQYLNVANTANEPETIAQGNDRVLRARLADARFFVEEDRKVGLTPRVRELDRVVFQKGLGTVGDKWRRLGQLQANLGGRVPGYDERKGHRAAELCKADLTTLIVGEFPELQGEMGRHYALAEGEAPDVADAIRDHYLPQGPGDPVPEGLLGAVLAVADRVDNLVGFFGTGLTASGSGDPYGLRRAALGVIRIALEGPLDVDLTSALGEAHAKFGTVELREAEGLRGELLEFFRGRLRAHYRQSYPAEVVEACLSAWQPTSIRDLDARLRAVEAFRQRPEFESLSLAFKRTFNIARDAPEGPWQRDLLEEEAEKGLAGTLEQARPAIEKSLSERKYEDALTTTSTHLYGPINRFFDEVLVMDPDEQKRDNRLRLVGEIASTLRGIAHFDKLSK